MSKAFVKESELEGELPPEAGLEPPPARNYITPAGYARLKAELKHLLRIERPEVVASAGRDAEQVFFGATVSVRPKSGGERTVTIVGADEVDTARGRVSWLSPIAKALLKARAGDVVRLETPGGAEQLEILEVQYLPVD